MAAAPIPATRAYELGLVNRLCPADELETLAAEMAAQIAANAPLSVAAAKRMVWESAGMPLAAAFERAEELFAPAYLSEDAQEGPRAFRDGRAPRWSGS